MLPIPTSMMYPALDPVEERRLSSNRPATRMEIARRAFRLQRNEILSGSVPVEEAPAHFAHRVEPDSLTRVRIGISRALNAAAERIAPEAA